MSLVNLDKQRDEYIEKLSALEVELYSSAKQEWFEKNATPEEQTAFRKKRIDLSNTIEELDTIKISKIADKFEANQKALSDGIEELSATISNLASSIKTLNQIGTLIGTISRILLIK